MVNSNIWVYNWYLADQQKSDDIAMVLLEQFAARWRCKLKIFPFEQEEIILNINDMSLGFFWRPQSRHIQIWHFSEEGENEKRYGF